MKITVTCAGCGKRYEVDGAHGGKKGKCSSCGERIAIPEIDPAAAPIAADSESYPLDERNDQPEASSFTPARGSGGFEQPERDRRPAKKPGRRPSRRIGAGPTLPSAPPYRAALIVLACAVAILGLVALVVPGARMNVGRVVALAGLVIFLYGYGSGAYIAFTEDDLYGWLYLIFPPFAAYYFVSRWDEMRSRLVMVTIGLALLAGGGRVLETGVREAPPDEHARISGAGSALTTARRSISVL